MKAKIKWLFFIAIVIAGIYMGVRLCLPTEIIDVHLDNELIVKNFPILKTNREKWWNENESSLNNKYNFPTTDTNGSYFVRIIDIGHGYEEEIPDRDWFLPGGSTDHLFCFNEMTVKNRCVRKDHILMEISKDSKGKVTFYFFK
ncbi:MAG: DUF943 family protein [Enterobacteriaceae bacterium]|jgi:hypothetical protein|nr:DUF943 family protein [Enterobacteriaceae bacterium]